MEKTGKSASGAVLLYDGTCALCNWLVSFTIRHDPGGVFQYASLQSSLGKQYLAMAGFPENELDTFIYVENDRIFTKSTAALKVLKRLNGLWPLLYPLIVLPKVLRDVPYGFIARHRYRWFGKFDECRLPDTDMKERILS